MNNIIINSENLIIIINEQKIIEVFLKVGKRALQSLGNFAANCFAIMVNPTTRNIAAMLLQYINVLSHTLFLFNVAKMLCDNLASVLYNFLDLAAKTVSGVEIIS